MMPDKAENTELLNAALAFLASGCSIVPTRNDGSKAPIGSWKKWQSERPDAKQLAEWFSDPKVQGFGIVTGAISGNLEMLEMEGRAVNAGMLEEVKEIAIASGLGEIWNVLVNGYVEMTPSGGIHFLYRIADEPVPGSVKLAQQPGENGGVECLAETRGEAAFCIVAPSMGTTHPSGKPWELINGSPALLPMLSMEERNAIFACFEALDKMPTIEVIREAAQPKEEGTGKSPGDDYNERATWDEILIPRGWTKVFTDRAGIVYWRRPGKSISVSATTGKNEADNFYCFSSSTEFETRKPYSKFAALTHLEFNGDYRACARELRRRGYGSVSAVPDSPLGASPMESERPLTPTQIANRFNDIADEAEPFQTSFSPTETEADPADTTEAKEFEWQLKKSRINRQVKRALDAEDALRTYDRFEFVNNLREELLLPEEEIDWVIPHLIPSGANITITAQYKAGKTTLVNNLAKSLADNTKFLNYFNPPNHDGRIVIFNYEVSENQYRRWMKDVAIENSDKITLVHLRGKSVPMIADFVRNEMVELLKRLECQTWILDPFARAFTGSGDENSNSDVGVFLDQLDIIKERSGVSNLVLPVHTGRAQESGIDRARGATRIDDWADVRWLLKKTEDGRFFSADGRDVLVDEQMLRFDEATRSLTLGGADAKTAKKRNLEDLWVETVEKHSGLNTGDLCRLLGKSTDDKGLAAARKSALYYRRVKTAGVGSATLWFPMGATVPYQMEHFTA